VLEDEYQDVLRIKFKEEQELEDLAERVDVIKRTKSVAAEMTAMGRTKSRLQSVAARNMSYNRTMSANVAAQEEMTATKRDTGNLDAVDEGEEDANSSLL